MRRSCGMRGESFPSMGCLGETGRWCRSLFAMGEQNTLIPELHATASEFFMAAVLNSILLEYKERRFARQILILAARFFVADICLTLFKFSLKFDEFAKRGVASA